MQLLLFSSVLAIILQSALTVHPGDPFPIDEHKPKPITSEDIINTDEVVEPSDHEIPSPSEPLTDPNDPNDDDEGENIILTTTKINKFYKDDNDIKENRPLPSPKSTAIDESHEDDDDDLNRKLSPSKKSSTLSPVKSINRKNLVKIGRWKYVDSQTKEIRYWYETEGGHMGTGWAFDGFICQAYNKSEPGTEPVYAFHSELRSLWTNTIQIDPKAPLIGNDQWISDGISFYTYRTSMNSSQLQPVVRYWNKLKGDATDVSEIRVSYLMMKGKEDDYDLENERPGWTLDKILFYALPIEN